MVKTFYTVIHNQYFHLESQLISGVSKYFWYILGIIALSKYFGYFELRWHIHKSIFLMITKLIFLVTTFTDHAKYETSLILPNNLQIEYSILVHCALRASSRCTYLFLMNVRTCVHMLYRGMQDLQTLIYFPFEQTIAHIICNSNIKSLIIDLYVHSSKFLILNNNVDYQWMEKYDC